jgi:hypothetical protein
MLFSEIVFSDIGVTKTAPIENDGTVGRVGFKSFFG